MYYDTLRESTCQASNFKFHEIFKIIHPINYHYIRYDKVEFYYYISI